jgi:hypothetical protein
LDWLPIFSMKICAGISSLSCVKQAKPIPDGAHDRANAPVIRIFALSHKKLWLAIVGAAGLPGIKDLS